MTLAKVVILFLVMLVVFGGGAFFTYRMFVEPSELDLEAEIAQANAPAPTPPPDYTVPRFEEAMKIVAAGDVAASQDALRNFITLYPKSTKLPEAKAELGQMNVAQIFTSVESPRKTPYTVVSGDSLLKISGKTDSDGELIMRANNLISIDLRIGQDLLVPRVAMSVFVDRASKTLTLLDEGNLFKEYPILALKIPVKEGTTVDTTVSDRLAMRGSDRVAFGSGGYAGAERWLMLGSNGIVIRGVPESADGEAPASMPPGVILDAADMAEIFPMVSRGATVTIQ